MTINSTIKPQLRTLDLTVIVVGLIIGMGIFRTPAEVAGKAGIPMLFFLAWITGAVVSLIGALTFAEIGSRYPVTGGFYKIFSHCYHPCFAFMVNWITVISNAASTAGVAIMGAEYIAPLLFPQLDPQEAIKILTITSVSVLFVVNFRGIRVSASLLNILMVVKIGMILLLISSLFFLPSVSSSTPVHSTSPNSLDLFKAFLICFIPVFFTYGGYQQTMNFGGDIRDAKRTMPKSIMVGIGIVLLLYLCVNYAYYHVLGFEGLKQSVKPAADVAGLMLGSYADTIVSFIMFFCVMAYVNVSMMSNPRIYYAMAEDKVMPAFFMRVNPKTQVQQWALTLFFVFILITLLTGASFQKILDYVMFFDSISLISAAAAIFVLRFHAKKSGEQEGVFKMWGYPFLPALFILIYLAVNISVLISNPTASQIGLLLFAAGYPLYNLIRFGRRYRSKFF